MKKFLWNAVFAAVMLMSIGAQAAFVNVTTSGGQDYQLTTITGTFNELESTLTLQDWWDDLGGTSTAALALELANLVGDSLGLPNAAANHGPHFVFRESVPLSSSRYVSSLGFAQNAVIGTTTYTWAVESSTISSVPLPAGFWLFSSGIALIISIRSKVRIKNT